MMKKRIVNRVNLRLPLMIFQILTLLLIVTLSSSNYSHVAEAQQINRTNNDKSTITDEQRLENFTGSLSLIKNNTNIAGSVRQLENLAGNNSALIRQLINLEGNNTAIIQQLENLAVNTTSLIKNNTNIAGSVRQLENLAGNTTFAIRQLENLAGNSSKPINSNGTTFSIGGY